MNNRLVKRQTRRRKQAKLEKKAADFNALAQVALRLIRPSQGLDSNMQCLDSSARSSSQGLDSIRSSNPGLNLRGE